MLFFISIDEFNNHLRTIRYKFFSTKTLCFDKLVLTIKQANITCSNLEGVIVFYRWKYFECCKKDSEVNNVVCVRKSTPEVTTSNFHEILLFSVFTFDLPFQKLIEKVKNMDYKLTFPYHFTNSWCISFYEKLYIPNHKITFRDNFLNFEFTLKRDEKVIAERWIKMEVEEKLCSHDFKYDARSYEYCCIYCGVIDEFQYMVNYNKPNPSAQLNMDYIVYCKDKNFGKILSTLYGYKYNELDDFELSLLDDCILELKIHDEAPDWKEVYKYFSDRGLKTKKYGGKFDYTYLNLYLPYHKGIRFEENNVNIWYYYKKVNSYNKDKNNINILYVIWKSFKEENKPNYNWVPMKLNNKTIKNLNDKWDVCFMLC